MHLLRLLPLLFTFLFLTLAAQAQEEDKTMSWIASGAAQATYGIDNLGFSTTLGGHSPGNQLPTESQLLHQSLHGLALHQPGIFWRSHIIMVSNTLLITVIRASSSPLAMTGISQSLLIFSRSFLMALVAAPTAQRTLLLMARSHLLLKTPVPRT